MPFASLPSLAAAVQRPRPNAKPPTRKTLKGRKDRAEAKVKKSVRQQCVDRDGDCRLYTSGVGPAHPSWFDTVPDGLFLGECYWPSQWAHMHTKRRSQTRGQAPEVRHTTAASLMLCRRHHDQYDGRQTPRLYITAVTRKGANGPLRFRRAK